MWATRGWASGPTSSTEVYMDRRGAKEERGREREAMSLWRRIVVLVAMASVMAFMSAPAAWAGGYGDDHGNNDDGKKDHKDDDDDKYKKHYS